jgi:hypothetical protein
MPIYFIHVRHGRRLAKDIEGKCFSDLKAAEREARRAAREMAAQRVRAGKTLHLSSRLEIADASGKIAAVVTFKDAIPIDDAE